MKDKEQILWEEKKIIQKVLKRKPQLNFESDITMHSVCINHMISEYERKKNFAIIREGNKTGKEILEEIGIRTFQTNYVDENTLSFLIDYIFRP